MKLNDAMDIIVSECPSEFRSSKTGKVATNKKGQVRGLIEGLGMKARKGDQRLFKRKRESDKAMSR